MKKNWQLEGLEGKGYTFGTAKNDACKTLEQNARDKLERKKNQNTHWNRILHFLDKYIKGEIGINSNEFAHTFEQYGLVQLGSLVLSKWAAFLIQHGRKLDDQLDILLSEVTTIDFSWNTKTCLLTNKLNSILVRREDIRSFEREVEEFLEGVGKRSEKEFDVLPVTQLLNQLQHTFDRTYDLCTFKLTTIRTERATYASILIAVVAACIALSSIL